MRNNTRKIFIASSMLNPIRELIPKVVNEVNGNSRSIQYELLMYENTAFPARNDDTQQALNELAATCDIFIFLIERDSKVGRYTMGEYKSALDACQSTSSRTPFILPYVVYSGNKTSCDIPYEEVIDGNVVQGDSIEQRLTHDFNGKKYVRFTSGDNNAEWDVDSNSFVHTLKRDLEETIHDSYYYRRQEELSYAHHISNTVQNIRNATTQYFVREELDGKIEAIAGRSSLLFLEGNSFSGKTRAVYELMRNNSQWVDADFYVFRCGYDAYIEDFNALSMYRSPESRHAVFFIDDFSNLLMNDDCKIESNAHLWQLLRSISPGTLPQWDKITVIMTMSGELTYHEKHRCYRKIFGDEIYAGCLKTTLNEVIVNFDIYNRHTFHKMAGEMVRCGIIPKENVRPGNYTIGSLFIDTARIKDRLHILAGSDTRLLTVMQLIKLQQMYCNHKRKGMYADIKTLWQFKNNIQGDDELKQALEYLCSKRWIVLDYENSMIERIYIDNYVIEAIQLPTDYLSFLIEYARSGKDYDVIIPERMAYILCDRMCLSQQEILSLIGTFGGEKIIVKSLYKICSKYKATLPATKWADQYAGVFCQNAIILLPYASVTDILDKILAVINNPSSTPLVKDVLSELYVKTTFRMLTERTHDIKSYFRPDVELQPLTMEQERAILSRIFSSDEYSVDKIKAPFSTTDFLDIFNLKRVTRFINKLPVEIVGMAEKASAHSSTLYTESVEEDFWGEEEVVDDVRINNIFIPQLGSLLIEAIVKTTTFKELKDIISMLRNATEQYICEAVSLPMFTNAFYKNITRLVQRYTYEDRFELFNYLISLKDNHTILDKEGTLTDIESNHSRRIKALNDVLPLLDEVSVIQAYDMMVRSGNTDGYTLSMYMKNKYLMFEHLLDAVVKHGQGNYLTNNQLLYMSKTVSDARMCLSNVMKIHNNDPAYLGDEYALGAYLNIKSISCSDAIEVAKRWKNIHPGKILRDATIGALTSKYVNDSATSIQELVVLLGVADSSQPLPTEAELYDRWGLSRYEIETMRLNPKCWNKIFQKLNRTGQKQLIRDVFDRLTNNRILSLCKSNDDGSPCYLDTCSIVFDEEYKTYILSEYIKTVFSTYDDIRQFIDSLCVKYPQLLITPYIYKVYLRKIINETLGKNPGHIDSTTRRKCIDRVNAILIEAYNYFGSVYTSSEVVESMSNLYCYRLKLVNGDVYDSDHVSSYAYEDRVLELTFSQYLDYIHDHETAYANSSFIHNALCTMNSGVCDYIYDKIKNIAKKNRLGIDMEKKSTSEDMQLSQLVMERLIYCDDTQVIVDKDIVYNYSPIKMLIYIADTKHISYNTMESYRKCINAPITSTYLNHSFKVIRHDMSLDDKYGVMKDLLDTYCDNNTLLSKSIQMFVNMLNACDSKDKLYDTIAEFPPEFCNTSEFIGVWTRKYFDVNFKTDADNALDEIHRKIVSHPSLIDIQIVNGYLNCVYRMVAHRRPCDVNQQHRDILDKCWVHLDATGNIDLNVLLQCTGNEPWEMVANQQSYIYFGAVCPENIVEYVAHRFNNNFVYEGKKSCLLDCLKNYAAHQYAQRNDLSGIIHILTLRNKHGKYVYNEELKAILKSHTMKRDRWSLLCQDLKNLLNACGVVKKS